MYVLHNKKNIFFLNNQKITLFDNNRKHIHHIDLAFTTTKVHPLPSLYKEGNKVGQKNNLFV